jgi:Domain of unknown function (DUF4214)
MIRGHIDALTSAGYILGWAFDTEAPTTPLAVGVADRAGYVIGAGLAHLYRKDLAAAGHGYGWCAFRLRADSVSKIRQTALSLIEIRLRTPITHAEKVNYLQTSVEDLTNVEQLLLSDPTVVQSIEQLDGCEALFREFVLAQGAEAFVRAAYIYVLGRSVDPTGLKHYVRLMRGGALSPLRLLKALAESDEFRSRPRLLCVPNSSAFPFIRGKHV